MRHSVLFDSVHITGCNPVHSDDSFSRRITARMKRRDPSGARHPAAAGTWRQGDEQMQVNGPSHLHGPQQINAPHANRPSSAAAAAKSSFSTSDELQISAEGNFLSKVHELPEIRTARVAELQSAIAGGAYDTDEKISAALDRFLDELA